ncbi:MAG: antibiotic biosynthesis monooxygenase [Nitrososphaerota archaeon]|nr:antibiotic biosynthesis monooxygenase [Nitrososphaerota archaeon]MDG7024145.1 antibiotic biosynthesis monooxygenase [Nitrososphaerota archaeon]
MAKKFARIIMMKAKPGKGGEFLKRFRDDVAATAVEIEGMRRLYLFRPAGKKDEFVAVSLWDDREAAEQYARSGKNKEYGRRLAAVQEGEERVKKYEVEVHVLGKRSATSED